MDFLDTALNYNPSFPMTQLREDWGVSIMVICNKFDSSTNNGSEVHEITDSCSVKEIISVSIVARKGN
jgi:signal recognition particle receptor subunit beta